MSKKQINDYYKKSFTVAQNSAMNIKEKLAAKNFSNVKSLKSTVRLPKNLKRNHYIYAGFALLLVLAFVAGRQLAPAKSSFGAVGSDGRAEAPKALATQDLNKKFEFPLTDDEGKEVAKIEYLVQSANLQDAFIYQGKLAKAVKGRTFLIFDLKITNPYTKPIEINTKDYLRVKVNGKEEQLAPEIHNDPVLIQAESTKYARIGMPINDSDKDIVLLIGELDGNKQTIKLNLSR